MVEVEKVVLGIKNKFNSIIKDFFRIWSGRRNRYLRRDSKDLI